MCVTMGMALAVADEGTVVAAAAVPICAFTAAVATAGIAEGNGGNEMELEWKGKNPRGCGMERINTLVRLRSAHKSFLTIGRNAQKQRI